MKTTIRNRAATFSIAAVASLAAVGLATGPALASTNPDTETAGVQAPQSAEFPTNPIEYADDFVRAFGAGDRASVENFATETAVKSLYQHDSPHADRWNRTSAQSYEGTTSVTYRNFETSGRLTVSVRSETAANGHEDAVDSIEFVSQEGEPDY